LEEKRLARRLRTSGDRAAARTLVTAHLPLVVRIARDFRHLHPNLLDLIQEGNLALILAVHRFDPDRPVSLGAYVASWVRTYIARSILGKIEAEGGLLVEGSPVTMTLAFEDAAGPAPDVIAEQREDQARLEQVLPEFQRQLTSREREIFQARLFSDRPSTLTQKGLDLGLSAERVRQIERELTERLRARFSGE
jgi:RNA polymerase sigma factor (sigma-70 family)